MLLRFQELRSSKTGGKWGMLDAGFGAGRTRKASKALLPAVQPFPLKQNPSPRNALWRGGRNTPPLLRCRFDFLYVLSLGSPFNIFEKVWIFYMCCVTNGLIFCAPKVELCIKTKGVKRISLEIFSNAYKIYKSKSHLRWAMSWINGFLSSFTNSQKDSQCNELILKKLFKNIKKYL